MRIVEPDLSGEEAVREIARLERAAAAGDADAGWRLARHALKDESDAKRFRKAKHLLAAGLAQRYPPAQRLAGVMLMRGNGSPPDEAAGLALILEAAWAGELNAVMDAALAHELGAGCRADPAKALYWWRLAAARGVAAAMRRVAVALKEGRGCESDAEGARAAAYAALKAGDAEAGFLLADWMSRPADPLYDDEAAVSVLTETALAGHAQAQYRLGLRHWAGRGVRVNQREALRWFARAAENEDVRALFMLAQLFLTGTLVALDRTSAAALLRRGKQLGDAQAAAALKSLAPLLRRTDLSAVRAKLSASRDTPALIESLLPRRGR